jgi:hypothetical protein
VVLLGVFGLAFLISNASMAPAQQQSTTATEKWRPKDGVYAGSRNFKASCTDAPDLFLNLAKKSISAGGEELCKIVKLNDTDPGAITLDVKCTDIDRETPYKKIIRLKKINDSKMLWQATADKRLTFAYPGVEISYCPDDAQRAHRAGENTK